jgi:hypothetical protein
MSEDPLAEMTSPAPEFGDGVLHRAEPCTPEELFCALFADPEDHVHFLRPAYGFVTAALAAVPAFSIDLRAPLPFLDGLVSGVTAMPRPRVAPDFELGLRVAREFAPAGSSDGAWLRGTMLANTIETRSSMALLKQLMRRFGDPASHEPYTERYAALLRSLGVPPGSITRPAPSGAVCSSVSYEHALLGVSLGFFPSTLGPETLGFNLWMASLGPCPLLTECAPALRARGACLDYLDRHDRAEMSALAREAVVQAFAEGDARALAPRVARGFMVAQRSYERWERAALDARPGPLAGVYGPPQDPDTLGAFAIERYAGLSYPDLYYCFANADRHPAIQVFGRVFVGEVFEKLGQAFDLDERLNSRHPPAYSERAVAELVAAQHEKNVRSRGPVTPVLAEPEAATREDRAGDAWARAATPAGSGALATTPDRAVTSDEAPGEEQFDVPSIIQVFDGSWLQGFADVQRASFEEYGWLFRIYASEHGDGDWAYNHCQIFRRAFSQLGPDVMLPKTDRRLYDLFDIGVAAVATLAVALNTRRFMPEILGINLGIEATGVGGSYMDQWKNARGDGAYWRALAWRLHNSIDNYADGHTKWSLSAVQSFMRRVTDATPAQVDAHWHRIWRLWRCQDILTHGSESERAALGEHLSLSSLAPTPV